MTNCEVHGTPGLSVRVGSGQIRQVAPGLTRLPGEVVLDAKGGAVIPGLHDHHIHLRALLARRVSLDVSDVSGPEAFDRAVAGAARAASAGRQLRVTGWSEQTAGPLDRHRLDALTGGVPARVQHRGGAAWVLNSAALRLAGVAGAPGAARASDARIERDDRGEPTGRLTRLDDWLRRRLATGLPAAWFGAELARFAQQSALAGVTGFTDATAERDQADVDDFASLRASGVIPQHLVLMAPPGLRAPAGGTLTLGPRKVMLDDPALPEVRELAELARQAHLAGSAVAVHCVTAEQLVVTVEALEAAGARAASPPGAGADRIEHASVVPPGYAARLASLGTAVVTQPGFIGERGDIYLSDVSAAEQDWLYPCASLIRAGVPVAASTDAPFGPVDPWRCIASAVTRRTPSGAVLGPGEAVPPQTALRMFTAAPQDPRQVRTVKPGQPADLCVLRAPLRDVLSAPSADWVLATIIDGQVVQPD